MAEWIDRRNTLLSLPLKRFSARREDELKWAAQRLSSSNFIMINLISINKHPHCVSCRLLPSSVNFIALNSLSSASSQCWRHLMTRTWNWMAKIDISRANGAKWFSQITTRSFLVEISPGYNHLTFLICSVEQELGNSLFAERMGQSKWNPIKWSQFKQELDWKASWCIIQIKRSFPTDETCTCRSNPKNCQTDELFHWFSFERTVPNPSRPSFVLL